jgi:hypothetical protein
MIDCTIALNVRKILKILDNSVAISQNHMLDRVLNIIKENRLEKKDLI